MTLDRIGRMSSGGNLVSFVSCYAEGIFVANWLQSCTSWAGYRAKRPVWRAVTRDEARVLSTVDHGKWCGLVAGGWIALFIALQGAGPDIKKCMTQLHCEWTEQVATVCPIAGFTGLLQRGGRFSKAGRANCLCGPA